MKKTQAKNKAKKERWHVGRWPLLIVLYALTVLVVFVGSQPTTYSLKVNDVSNYDIVAPRNAVDKRATEVAAQEAASRITRKILRSDDIAEQNLQRVASWIATFSEARTALYMQATKATSTQKNDVQGANANTKNNLSVMERRVPSPGEIDAKIIELTNSISHNDQLEIDSDTVSELLKMKDDHFSVLTGNFADVAKLIMQKAVDANQLKTEIADQLEFIKQNQEFFTEDATILDNLLKLSLTPNVVYDQKATENARNDAYQRVLNNPIMINRGTRIVSQGDIITEETFELLQELDLTSDSGFEWINFLGVALYIALCYAMLLIYLSRFEKQILRVERQVFTLIVAFVIVLLISFWVAQKFPLAVPVSFFIVVICVYFNLRFALVGTIFSSLVILPMTLFQPYFIPLSLVIAMIAALFTRSINNQGNYGKLILATVVTSFSFSLAVGLMQHDSATLIATNMVTSLLSSSLSVIAALGMMPLFELLFNNVSPLRLIELSQPGHPLLKRLFVEAPGTSQHSIMVATLADAGAEAIGANALVCRVGSYYHDIGKLENPLMFTENQEGENPHDFMEPKESASIIIRHPQDGVKLGMRYRLPKPILEIIEQHHGKTILQYFYHKALEKAEAENLPKPSIDDFMYKTPLPQNREVGVVMLADSVEAAMKSANIHDLEQAEKLMRNIVKIKNEQNQFMDSGLSYSDVEKVIKAFLQVYAGQFHGRIEYPKDSDQSVAKAAESRLALKPSPQSGELTQSLATVHAHLQAADKQPAENISHRTEQGAMHD